MSTIQLRAQQAQARVAELDGELVKLDAERAELIESADPGTFTEQSRQLTSRRLALIDERNGLAAMVEQARTQQAEDLARRFLKEREAAAAAKAYYSKAVDDQVARIAKATQQDTAELARLLVLLQQAVRAESGAHPGAVAVDILAEQMAAGLRDALESVEARPKRGEPAIPMDEQLPERERSLLRWPAKAVQASADGIRALGQHLLKAPAP